MKKEITTFELSEIRGLAESVMDEADTYGEIAGLCFVGSKPEIAGALLVLGSMCCHLIGEDSDELFEHWRKIECNGLKP